MKLACSNEHKASLLNSCAHGPTRHITTHQQRQHGYHIGITKYLHCKGRALRPVKEWDWDLVYPIKEVLFALPKGLVFYLS